MSSSDCVSLHDLYIGNVPRKLAAFTAWISADPVCDGVEQRHAWFHHRSPSKAILSNVGIMAWPRRSNVEIEH